MNKKIPLNEIFVNKIETKSAVLALNVQSIQQIQIIANLSEVLSKEIIIQFSSKYIPYFDQLIGVNRILDRYQSFKYLYFHLDHCDDENLIFQCINWKFDSVMFDGSSLPINENISRTSKITALAHKKNVLVEGEVGVVGGVEDGFIKNGASVFNLEEAILFYENAGIDMLALGIGNSHGVYQSIEHVNVNLLSIFQNRLNQKKANLVLHGATGLDDKQIFEAIKNGVVKVNFSTEFKILYQSIINELINNEVHDEIYFYNLLKSRLEIAVKNIINKLDSQCI